MTLDHHSGLDVFGDVPAALRVPSALYTGIPSDLVVSYDIACQWHKNFFSRISKYPEHLPLVLRVFVPVVGFRTTSTRKLLVELSWLWTMTGGFRSSRSRSLASLPPSLSFWRSSSVISAPLSLCIHTARAAQAALSFRASQIARSVQSVSKGRIHR